MTPRGIRSRRGWKFTRLAGSGSVYVGTRYLPLAARITLALSRTGTLRFGQAFWRSQNQDFVNFPIIVLNRKGKLRRNKISQRTASRLREFIMLNDTTDRKIRELRSR